MSENCELCGNEVEELKLVIIEGVKLRVCQECLKFGKELHIKEPVKIEVRSDRRKMEKIDEELPSLVFEFNIMMRKQRENLGISQKELAKKINEKQSVISKLEQGSLNPSDQLRIKVEKALGIRLIE